uniref:Uncharacterized protein n=1 Tax=Oryza glumipatula TaxID=40148 RepID=A0A0E0A4J9_9ORYZ
MLLPSPVATAAHHHHVHAAGDGVVISPTASSATAIKHDLTDPYWLPPFQVGGSVGPAATKSTERMGRSSGRRSNSRSAPPRQS